MRIYQYMNIYTNTHTNMKKCWNSFYYIFHGQKSFSPKNLNSNYSLEYSFTISSCLMYTMYAVGHCTYSSTSREVNISNITLLDKKV